MMSPEVDLVNPVQITEFGTRYSKGPANPITGIPSNGELPKQPRDCAKWTSRLRASRAYAGSLSAVKEAWSGHFLITCNQKGPIYCVEQPTEE